MWEGFWGRCRARRRAESRGHHPWGGGDGESQSMVSFGSTDGVGLWEHLDERSLGKQIMQGGQRWNLGDEL